MNKQVLIVEDDLGSQAILTRMLHAIDPDIWVDCVQTAESAYRLLSEAESKGPAYHAIFCDLNLPGSDGLSLWNYATKRYPDLDFLFVSGVSSNEWIAKLKDRSDWPILLKKPIDEEQLRRVWKDRFEPLGELTG